MALTELIAATAAEATSEAINPGGVIQITADDLSGDEWAKVLRIRVDGTYEEAIIGGLPVILTKRDPSIIYEAYAEIKVEKSATALAAAVGYAQ